MAKGQKRSNREIKKPKQEKVAPKPAIPLVNRRLTAVTGAKQVNGKG